ncbi:MAG: TRAP transporter substrate-binding protein [Parvibaculum sp.]
MKRRSFLAGAGLVAAASATLSAPAIASGKRNLKMVTTWPKNYPGMGISAERLGKRITAMTDGALTVKVFAAGELVPALESFDAVSSGAADIYHGAEYYWQGKSKAYNFFTAVPFGMTANEINAWIYHGGGQPLWDELSKGFNIKPFMAANTGVQMAGWFRKEIKTVEDIKGLKVRMPGLGGEVMRRLGAAAVTLPGGEIYPSLQNGTIDATEWVGPWNDMAFGFYQVAKFYYWPGFHEPGSSLSAGFNLAVWESFTATQQEIIRAACAAENDYTLAEYNHWNGRSLKTLIEKHGVQLKKFSPEVLAAFRKTSDEVLADTAKSDAFTGKVYASFKEALDASSEWSRIGEQGFVEARQG